MRPSRWERAANAGKAAFIIALCFDGGISALAQPADRGSGLGAGSDFPALMTREKSAPEDLYLQVFINDYDTNKIAAFHRFRDGCLTIAEEDLKEFNFKTPDGARHASGGLCLEKMPGVTYRYDEAAQIIHLKVLDEARVPLEFDARWRHPEPASGQDLSAVFNYALFASGGTSDYLTTNYPQYQGVSANVDGRVFSGYGVFEQSFTANSTATELIPALLRLDTRWSYENPETLVTYSAGDVISGSLNWTTSIRMGGVQIRRDFLLRPDLVTMPMQQFSGSAAVPSTVQVFNNQARAFSQDITGGPFNINNIPLATGPGTMRIVLKDATGKETVSEYAYYNSTNLLAPGLFDYSIETGFARRFYGVYSDDYDGNPIASASARFGVTSRLTVEGHAEGGAGLANLGGGVDFGLWQYGVASLAFSGSNWNGVFGGQGYGSFETSIWGARLMARTLRSLGDYEDLASVTAPKCPAVMTGCASAGNTTYKKMDQLSLSFPLPFDTSSFSLSYTDSSDYGGASNKVATASYGRRFLFDNSTISANVFEDLEQRNSWGAYASITYAWGKYQASAITESSQGNKSAGGSLSRSLDQEAGSYGYSVMALEGAQPYNSASASYRASAFQATAGVIETGRSVQATAQLDGAVAILHGVHFANRIDNSFAVVDTGIPGARVLYENNPVGETDSGGTLLIPSMRAREQNAIAIDPTSLPVQADMPETKQTIVPAARGGMTVRFKGEAAPPSAMVSFKDGKGEWLPVSSEVWINGGGASFPIGYDGEAYITGLGAANTALVKKPDGTPCNASFAFTPNPQAQVRIEGVICVAEENGKIAMQNGGETVVVKR